MVFSPSALAASSRCRPSISTKRSPSARTLIGTCWPSLSMLAARVDEIAASMLKDGQQVPIKVRADGDRFVLIEGLHRLEAAKALGEKTIVGYRVDARKH